jgi:hypothetical protein
MGHCASILDTKKDVFISKELIEQNLKMRDDAGLRKSFVTYIKTGVWMDKIFEFIPKSQQILTHEERQSYECSNVLLEYRTAEGRIKDLDLVGSAKEHRASWSTKYSSSGSGSNTPTHQGKNKKSEEELKCFSEFYFNIETSSCMGFAELLPILIRTLLPLYMTSKEYTNFSLNHTNSEMDRENSFITLTAADFSSTSEGNEKVPTKVSERAVNIFHGCAAYFDEASILEELETATWLHNVQKLLLNHALGITVVDVSDASLPIVFCNHRYASMVGASDRGSVEGKSMRAFYSADAVINATNVNVTNATATAKQVGELEAALRSGKVEKFAIAQQTQGGGQAFLDLVTVLSGRMFATLSSITSNRGFVGPISRSSKYAAIVHVVGNKHTKSTDLKVCVIYVLCVLLETCKHLFCVGCIIFRLLKSW